MKLFKRLSFAAVLISATALTPLNAQSTPDSEGNDANLIAADGSIASCLAKMIPMSDAQRRKLMVK